MWLKGNPGVENKAFLLYYKNEYYVGYFYQGAWYTKDKKILTDKIDSVYYQTVQTPKVQDKCWIARDKSGLLYIYRNKPIKRDDYFELTESLEDRLYDFQSLELPEVLYREVTFENSPQLLDNINVQDIDNL
jgi:hypothetical protein